MDSSSAAANWPATIATARLTLRPARRDDLAGYRRLWTDAAVRRHLGGPVEGERLAAYERGYTAVPYFFSAVLRDGGAMVGSVTIDRASRFEDRREISYHFLPEHWGHGYAREAVGAALEWAFDAVPSEDPSIVAVTQEANAPSRRLLESVGMSKVDGFVEFGEPQAMYAKAPAPVPLA